MKIEKRIEELKILREKYEQGEPLVSDEVFDMMEKELRREDSNNPYFNSVGGESIKSSTFEKTNHVYPMLSIQKAKTCAEIEKWKSDNASVVGSHKLDGFAINLHYKKYEDYYYLYRASSRGNGETGENITENIKQIKNVPLIIKVDNFKFDEFHVRGEVITTKSDFKEMIEKGIITEESNIRNISAGSCRQKDPKITAQRKIKFVAYDLIFSNQMNYLPSLSIMYIMGFEVVENFLVNDIERCIELITEERKHLDYEIDGIVFRVNEIAKFQELGYTGHHPRGSIAYKFKSETATTKLLTVEWNTTRTGMIAPTAVFEPVVVGGAKIQRATLFNLTHIYHRLKLTENAKITVARNNDVIPYIVSAKPNNNNLIKWPQVCPSCGHITVIKNTGSADFLYCTNLQCKSVLKEKLIHFVSSMNMKGISEATIEKLFEEKLIKKFEDIYYLSEHTETMINWNGYSRKSVSNILNIIEKSRNTNLSTLIHAIGIPGVGKENAKIIASYVSDQGFTHFSDFLIRGKLEGLLSLDGIGEKLYNNIVEVAENYDYVVMEVEQQLDYSQNNTSSVLSEKSFCITGTLPMGRDEIISEIEKLGGTFKSGVSKKLDYLIVGEKAGGKKKKAEKLGVDILTWDQFCEMVGLNTEEEKPDDIELF